MSASLSGPANAVMVGTDVLASGTVVFDAQSTADSSAAAVSAINHSNITVGPSANRALVVQLVWSNKAITNESVTYDSGGSNQSCTLIKEANTLGTVGRAALYGLVAPTSGKLTLNATWTGLSDVYIAAASFSGVNQTGGATTFPHSATGTTLGGSSVSVAITSAAGNAVVAVCASDVDVSSVNNTQIFLDNATPLPAPPEPVPAPAPAPVPAPTPVSTPTLTGGILDEWAFWGDDYRPFLVKDRKQIEESIAYREDRLHAIRKALGIETKRVLAERAEQARTERERQSARREEQERKRVQRAIDAALEAIARSDEKTARLEQRALELVTEFVDRLRKKIESDDEELLALIAAWL